MEEIRHRLIREAIRLVGLDPPYREITSMADMPGGTGLGSSGSFTTALLKALHLLKKNLVSSGELAEQACHIEIDVLKEPVGKQDQYIAAFGGMTCLRFLNNDQVEVQPLAVSNETLYNLEDNLMLFFTGITRSASSILKDQDEKSKRNDSEMTANLHFVKEIGPANAQVVGKGRSGGVRRADERALGTQETAIAQHEQRPDQRGLRVGAQQRRPGRQTDRRRRRRVPPVLAEDKTRLRRAMREINMDEMRFRFDFEGTKLVVEH